MQLGSKRSVVQRRVAKFILDRNRRAVLQEQLNPCFVKAPLRTSPIYTMRR